MQVNAIEHVSLWVDDKTVHDGAFPQAIDWAVRLDLPLRITVTSAQFVNHSRNNGAKPSPADHGIQPLIEKIKGWGTACIQKRVVLETSFWTGGTEAGAKEFFRPAGLCVCEELATHDKGRELIPRWIQSPRTLLLLSPARPASLTRILALYHASNPNSVYLQTIARLSQATEAEVVFLIVARSEREAQMKRGFVEGVCASLDIEASFDSITACDPRSAVAGVVAWRECSHVIVEYTQTSSWWDRFRRDPLDQFRGLSDTLSVLVIPETGTFDIPRKVKKKSSTQSLFCRLPEPHTIV